MYDLLTWSGNMTTPRYDAVHNPGVSAATNVEVLGGIDTRALSTVREREKDAGQCETRNVWLWARRTDLSGRSSPRYISHDGMIWVVDEMVCRRRT